tara:strand:+ start:49 stop:1716 length:1668 start_codon:yes stop_codon:yes gene_type:complete
MEEKEENKHIFHPDTHELKQAEPPTLMQYLRSLRDNQFREDERNRIFGQGPIIRDPRTNEGYTNPLLLLGDVMDTVNDKVTLKNIAPMLQFLPEDNTPDKLKNIANYSLKDFQYDAMDFVEEKAGKNIDTGLPILDKALVGAAVLGTAYAVPDATDFLVPGAADTIRFANKINWKQLSTKLDDWLDPFKYSLFKKGSRDFAVPGGGSIAQDGSMLMHKSDGASKSNKVSGQGFTNITKNNLKLFNQIGWTDSAKLDIQEMLYGVNEAGKPILSNYKRRLLKASIADANFDFRHFKEHRPEIVKDFLEGLHDLNIDPKTIHAHHVSGLRVTSSLFDGLTPGQRKKLIRIFQKEGLALGNDPKNLIALHSSSHLGVLHPFLEKQIGKYGQLLIDPKKIKNMSPKAREKIVKKFAKIIKKSEAIAMEHSRKWLDEQFLNMAPEAAFRAKMDMLEQAFNNEVALRELLLANIKQPKVFSKDVKFTRNMKQIQKQLLKGDINSPKQLSVWDIDEKSLDIWSSYLKSQPEVAKKIMKEFNFDPKQLELNFDLPPRQLDLDL